MNEKVRESHSVAFYVFDSWLDSLHEEVFISIHLFRLLISTLIPEKKDTKSIFGQFDGFCVAIELQSLLWNYHLFIWSN